ncbi:hypothetical protein HRbin22_01771 [Candidatus Thermoflexus japonica]|uniref:DUF2007 domain-containing protein n=1 Tax=Candidatus Thermoflexus japonica TaxID=2035417 RepID=A0A2H5Y7U4_9CHLR|nr:hypothetical protein HRbin22_01771 [Candidatus Thermoflexus japonica]
MVSSEDWVLVYEAGNLIEGQMVQVRLEQEGIPARLRYEAIHTLIAPTFQRVEVLVPAAWAEQALELLSSGLIPPGSDRPDSP